MGDKRELRPCGEGTYPCAHYDCGADAIIVETVRWDDHGTPGVGFYGYCLAHLPR